MHRVTTDEFSEDHEVTIGVEFGTMLLKMEEATIKLQIWDTAGQESFQSVTKIFYRGAHGVLLTYSIASMSSFKGLGKWLEEVRTHSEANVIIVLVGNQCDREEDREVSTEAAQRFAKENGIHFFIEASAKTSENVQTAFLSASKIMYKRHFKQLQEQQRKSGKSLSQK